MKLFKQNYQQQTDEELMGLIITKSNEKAFEELYNRYYKKLLWFCMRIVGNKEQSEDIIQDTFIKIIDKPEAFNSNQKFSTWIYTIVNNASLNVLSKETNRDKLMSQNYVQIDFTHLNLNIDAKLIQQKINAIYKELNEKEQAVFVLRFEQELSIKEIAKIIQIPEGTVKSCLYNLLKKMAHQLKAFQLTN
ncbi:MAG: RNA polymerase sigma factor [Bacteroidia bacterium]